MHIANASLQHQQCIGISVLKNNFSLENETLFLMNDEVKSRIKILHDYDFEKNDLNIPIERQTAR